LKRKLAVFLLLLLVYPAISETMNMKGTIQEVKTRYQGQLMELPGVISVGIGKNDQGKPAIIIGLDGKEHESAKQIPETLDGYPVVTQDIGPVRAQKDTE